MTATTGRLVWYELLTVDPAGAIAFYTDVVGWKTEAFGADYTMFVGAQGPVGGAAQLPEAAKAMGATAYWQANVQVADVDASVEQVKALGGKIHHVETVPAVGRFAVIADPQGAVISIFTPNSEGAPHDTSQAGEASWHELHTTDHEAAMRFYNAIVGWEQLDMFDMGPMGTYLLWGREGTQLGGMMTMPSGLTTPDGRTAPPGWMIYFTTLDLEAALARAQARGARVIHGPADVPGGQRIVQLLDPQGGVFALVTPRA